MKTKHFIATLVGLTMISTTTISSDEVIVEAKNTDISESLDLTAVANLFGQVKDLEEFEKQLNNSELQLSNLDLNNDGEVDYLRIVEEVSDNVHLILIQAILAQDIYQDVATILVEKETKEATKSTSVQVIGDSYIYGNNYIIEPVYIYVPVIYDHFWANYYHPWYSPYYWGYYPPYYHRHHCVYAHAYRSHIYNYNRHHHCSYRYVHHPHPIYNNVKPVASRRDYAQANPTNSFTDRNTNTQVRNKRDLQIVNRSKNNSTIRSTRPAITSRGNSTRISTTQRNYTRTTTSNSRANTRQTTTMRKNSTSTRNNSAVDSRRNSTSRTSVSRPTASTRSSYSTPSRTSSNVSRSSATSSRNTSNGSISSSRSSSSNSRSSNSRR